MDRQRIFDNFINTVNGHGRSADAQGEQCLYFPDNHPGCALGSQPGFRERFKSRFDDEGTVYEVVEECPDVSEFFGVEDDSDLDFLSDLQNFHDKKDNWKGKFLNPSFLERFCKRWGLECPQM